MKLILELDLELLPDHPAADASRILRYWAGALAQMDLSGEVEYPLMNSSYDTQVGRLRLIEAGPDDSPADTSTG